MGWSHTINTLCYVQTLIKEISQEKSHKRNFIKNMCKTILLLKKKKMELEMILQNHQNKYAF